MLSHLVGLSGRYFAATRRFLFALRLECFDSGHQSAIAAQFARRVELFRLLLECAAGTNYRSLP